MLPDKIDSNDSPYYAAICDVGHGCPVNIQTSRQLAPLIGKTESWIERHAGVKQRHVSARDDDPAQLVASIAQPMIDRHGAPDLVINAGALTKQLIPDTSVFINRELGLAGVPGFTINATCLSFLTAWQTAQALISIGDFQRILICSSEFGSRGRNFQQPESAALIGDGAAVAMLQRSSEPCHVAVFSMETWPEAAGYTEVRGGGVGLPPNNPKTTAQDNLFHMDGPGLLRFVYPRLKTFLQRFLDAQGLTVDDIDLIVPHQTSAAGFQLLRKIGFPEARTVNILAEYGNCVAASIPMALSIAAHSGRLEKGDRVLVVGTAAGVSFGAAIVTW